MRAKDSTQEVKKDEKRKATRERHLKFADVYQMVNKINRVGRLVFAGDPANLALFETKWPRWNGQVTVVSESEVDAPAEQPATGDIG